MEWKPGLILRIRNYKFEDDNTTRDKYTIVLHINDKEAYLIHSLTTTQNSVHVPGLQFGCSVYNNIPYYYIPRKHIIGNQFFYFEKDTFIFFRNNVRKESVSKFEKAATVLFGITSLGVLTNEELKRIIKCALKSKFIPAEIEKELSAFKASL